LHQHSLQTEVSMAVIPSRARHGWIAAGLLALASLIPCPTAAGDPPPFDDHSKRMDVGTFGFNTDGPAVDAEGNLFVVNFLNNGTIGKLAKGASQFVTFTTLDRDPDTGKQSVGNGLRFDRDGRLFIADFKNQNVLVIERGETNAKPYFHSDQFHQPNDLAVAFDGTLYASDPDFHSDPHSDKRGQIWRITRGPDGKGQGVVMQTDRAKTGLTNGIDLNPDGTTLYVSESDTQDLWAYRLDGNHLRDPHKVFHFPGPEIDGVRTDVDGRIYVARLVAGEIDIIKPAAVGLGTQVRKVTTQGHKPTNLTFGGPDGKTVFVTQMDGGFVESFRTDRPGREPCLQAPNMC
jgi:sugar lactone lactonase YvrE